MSGIEIAGLVLGCLPLIIQAIESYNEGLDPVKGFFGRDKELPIFIRKLRAQYDHYDQTIQLLFGSITSAAEFAMMINDPGSSQDLWKSKEAALQDKLQNTYSSYQRTMMEIERITKKIASKLDLDRAVEVTRNDLEALLIANPKKADNKFEIRKRVRFGMNKKTIKALLEELDECNKSLERFTEKSEKIETYHRATKPSYASRLQKLQRYAKTLHDSLSVCWSCSCRLSHRTSLELEPREHVFASKGQKPMAMPKTSFKVAFSTAASDVSGVSWLVQAAEISVEEEEDDCLAAVTPLNSNMKRMVSFGSLPPYAVMDPTERPFASREEVKDLCESIRQLHKNAPRIGFLLDSKSKLRGAYSIDTSETQVPSMEMVSLEDLLKQPPIINGRRSKLSMKDRYSLAVTLASSVLYLNSTPWLANEWTARDILFHRTPNTAQPINIQRPYLAPAAVAAANGTLGKSSSPDNFRNTVLIALAITLLELYFGVTAEKYQQLEGEEDMAEMAKQPGPWKLWALARSWTFNESGNLSAAFQNAIRHCITGSSDPCASLQDTECLQAAVENIVLPLQEELDQFLGKATK